MTLPDRQTQKTKPSVMKADATARRPGLVSMSVVCFAALSILIALGVWQTKRLFWKNDLIASIASRAKAPPVTLETLRGRAREHDDLQFMRVKLTGVYKHDSELHFHAIHTVRAGGPGWRIVTPFTTTDGTDVLVDRGFVPASHENHATRRGDPVTGTVEIIGVVRTGYMPQGTFTPRNEPHRNRWYWLDWPAAMTSTGLNEALPFVIQLEARDHAGKWPEALKITPSRPNNHLGYALTWFGMAFALISVYIALMIKEIKARSRR